MAQELYYKAPDDRIFKELKCEAIKLWKTYDNTYGYVDKKVNRIIKLENIGDNFMYIFAMFDPINQQIILNNVSDETCRAIRKRLI